MKWVRLLPLVNDVVGGSVHFTPAIERYVGDWWHLLSLITAAKETELVGAVKHPVAMTMVAS